MRKFTAILFLTLFTISSTEAGQLLKLPLLFQHLNEHMAAGRSHSVLDFITEHYLENHGNDFDEDEDRQLPFKTFNLLTVGNLFLVPDEPEWESGWSFSINQFNHYTADPGLSNYHAEIFHPPSQV
jgi:hypothetical protein